MAEQGKKLSERVQYLESLAFRLGLWLEGWEAE